MESGQPLLSLFLSQMNGLLLCRDFKITFNQFLMVDKYSFPTAQELYTAGGKKFSKQYLPQAFLQLELHLDSLKYCTHKGFFIGLHASLSVYIASVPAIFNM